MGPTPPMKPRQPRRIVHQALPPTPRTNSGHGVRQEHQMLQDSQERLPGISAEARFNTKNEIVAEAAREASIQTAESIKVASEAGEGGSEHGGSESECDTLRRELRRALQY